MGNSPVQFTCQFGNPRYIDGTVPTPPYNYAFSWQFASETCSYNTAVYAPTTTITASSSIALYGSITAGELLIILFTFIMIILELTKMLIKALDRIRTKKKFLNYSGGEVEVKEEL